jgi:hypothetical protein
MSGIYRLTIEIPRTVKNLMPNVDQEIKKFLAMKCRSALIALLK